MVSAPPSPPCKSPSSPPRGRPICVERSITGEILIRAIGASDWQVITGRTADVVAGYLDSTPVWIEDRGDMTLRRRIHLA